MKAFPSDKYEFDIHGNKQPMGRNEGMDLRDYFAAKAISAVISGSMSSGATFEAGDEKVVAKVAYKVADAMMEARTK